MAKEKSDFQKEVEAKAYERVSGYFTKNEEQYSKCYFSGYCDGAEWQRNRVWHPISEKAVLSNFVLLYDGQGGFMSPPCRWPFDDFAGFVEAMNKKYGANYTQWAYLKDITPIEKES